MFGISMWEVVLILVVALIVLGPKQLTETARVLGRLYREILRMASDVRSSIDLDSLTSTNHYPEPTAHKPEPTPSSEDVQSGFPSPGEKSGPDFYADLLESSKEEDKQEQSTGANPQEPQESAAEQAKEDGSASRGHDESPESKQAEILDEESKQRAKSD